MNTVIVIIPIVISLVALVYSIVRDKANDTADLIDKITKLETDKSLMVKDIDYLKEGMKTHNSVLNSLTDNVNDIKVKLERVLGILTQKAETA